MVYDDLQCSRLKKNVSLKLGHSVTIESFLQVQLTLTDLECSSINCDVNIGLTENCTWLDDIIDNSLDNETKTNIYANITIASSKDACFHSVVEYSIYPCTNALCMPVVCC